MNHFVSLVDWPTRALHNLIDEAITLKREYRTQGNLPVLQGKTLAMIFQQPSLRTRVSFELAMKHLGGRAFYLSAADIGLGYRESTADITRTLGHYVDGIVARVAQHTTLIEMMANSPVPIINALTNFNHPCQAMADVLTIYEEFGRIAGLRVAYVGNSHNDVTRSLIFAAAKFDFQIVISSPTGHSFPHKTILDQKTLELLRAYGWNRALKFVDNPDEAVLRADVVYTDTWLGMGKDEEAEAMRHIFMPYQVNSRLVALAAPHAIVLHCMPAIRGQEITNEVADGPQSRMLIQAENRLHAQKPILARLLGS